MNTPTTRQEKQRERECKKQAKLEKKERAKQAKQVKEAANAEKKERAKQAKQVKEAANAEKKEKKALAEAAKAEKKALAEAKKAEKDSEKYEVRKKSLELLLDAGKKAASIRQNGEFTTGELEEAYKQMNPNINPYTLSECDYDRYDINAAIRGIMYETSPSSQQHWFRYGCQKNHQQVAPWLFANKNLAMVNKHYKWKNTTSEIATTRRQNKGLWQLILVDTSLGELPEEYGEIPSAEMLNEASQNRKKNMRKKAIEQKK